MDVLGGAQVDKRDREGSINFKYILVGLMAPFTFTYTRANERCVVQSCLDR